MSLRARFHICIHNSPVAGDGQGFGENIHGLGMIGIRDGKPDPTFGRYHFRLNPCLEMEKTTRLNGRVLEGLAQICPDLASTGIRVLSHSFILVKSSKAID